MSRYRAIYEINALYYIEKLSNFKRIILM